MTGKERPDLVWIFLLPEHLAALNAGQSARLDIPVDPQAGFDNRAILVINPPQPDRHVGPGSFGVVGLAPPDPDDEVDL